jgi:hypothetical protein
MKRRLQAWRPLTLCWAKPVRPAAPSGARTTSHATHLHRHSTTLNLHFAVSMQNRPERVTAATLHFPAPPAVARPAGATHTERRHLTLHHLRTDTSRSQRETMFAFTRRVDRVHSFRTTNVAMPSAERMPEAVVARPVTSARAPEAVLPAQPRRRAAMTLATPTRESRAAAPTQAPSKPMRSPAATTPLVWRKSTSPAREPVDEQSIAESDSTAARARSNSPAPISSAGPPAPAITAQQAREVLRANLLDSTVADRLADDVIRRVEKRMRIERERRGL